MQVTDPVSDGFVASLARPGGNVTGFTIFEHSFAGKWLEMLKEVVPTMTRVAVLQNPDHPAWNAYVRAVREIASRMNVEVMPMPASGPPRSKPDLMPLHGRQMAALSFCQARLSPRHRDIIAACRVAAVACRRST